ncbi:cobalamin biosynthesis protein [Citrobacter koseri]|nr:cobalamin biosynthesis protein [Citrobacter koseri]
MTVLAWCIAWLLDFVIGDPQKLAASGTLDWQFNFSNSTCCAALLP